MKPVYSGVMNYKWDYKRLKLGLRRWSRWLHARVWRESHGISLHPQHDNIQPNTGNPMNTKQSKEIIKRATPASIAPVHSVSVHTSSISCLSAHVSVWLLYSPPGYFSVWQSFWNLKISTPVHKHTGRQSITNHQSNRRAVVCTRRFSIMYAPLCGDGVESSSSWSRNASTRTRRSASSCCDGLSWSLPNQSWAALIKNIETGPSRSKPTCTALFRKPLRVSQVS